VRWSGIFLRAILLGETQAGGYLCDFGTLMDPNVEVQFVE
jgi:hypothetical protein